MHKTHVLQEANKKSDKKPGDNIILNLSKSCCPNPILYLTRHNPGPLQRRSWENRNVLGGVQALARLHQPQRQRACLLSHCAPAEEAEGPNGSEERAIRLHCKMSQVKQLCIWNYIIFSASLSRLKKATITNEPLTLHH